MPCAVLLLSACQAGQWAEPQQIVVADGMRGADGGDAADAARVSDADASGDASDPGDPGSDPTGPSCEPYTDAEHEMVGKADAFPDPGPDLGMTWRPEVVGVYVASLAVSGDGSATFYLLEGECGGSLVAPIAGIDGAWPGFAFVASPEHAYTFVIEADPGVETVQLSIALGCDHVDDRHCVREDDEGEPVCGLRYAADHTADDTSCEPIDAPGDEDARCPDTTFRDQLVEGCCRPSGECGHLDSELGCHTLAQTDWASEPPKVFYCDDRAEPDPPPYFECSVAECESALDCCADPSHGNASCVEGFCVPAG